ncbi:MAG TPA: LytTR family DNA-binding domain-containing protein [Opitutus sp.]|nr:LytTR family DNA-binding domain-containing protein [Opitutus sp.]
MRRIRTLIVDDEPLARDGLTLIAERDPEVEVIGTCADGRHAVESIRATRPDLVFLDVQMPQLDGFEVLAALPPVERPVVVFVTAYEQHAIRAFEINAIDYLLKPFTDARFAAALGRAKREVRRGRTRDLTRKVEKLLEYARELDAAGEPQPGAMANSGSLAAVAPEYSDRIVLKADGALHFIKTRDVIWIEAQGDFVKVQTAGKTQLVRETLQSMERKLDAAKFLRIHRSFLVNLEHVRRVETALYGDYSVFMSDGTKLRLSRNYRAKLKAVMKRRPRG